MLKHYKTISAAVFLTGLLSTQAIQAQQNSPVIYNPVVEQIGSGFTFTEGPKWVDTLGGLIFSDVNANRIYFYSPSADSSRLLLTPSGNSNGLELDSTGALLLAQHGNRGIARITAAGQSMLATQWNGKRLNSPNDLTVNSNGSIFFTDPPYGITAAQAEIGFNGVYRINPQGKLSLLDSTIQTPNGIVFSPGDSVLYVNNSANNRIYKWTVLNDSTFGSRQEFASVAGTASGNADGMTVDSLGNVYAVGSGGIWIISPAGTFIDTINIRGQLTNVEFGGRTRDTLYITAADRLYRVYNGIVLGLNSSTANNESLLLTNFPNPAVNSTAIPLSIPKAGYVKLEVHNMQGHLVAALADGTLQAGDHVFNWNCSNNPGGLYILKLTYNDRSVIKTCVVNNN